MIRLLATSVGIAIEALVAHKQRALLTTLGITIGVTAVIAMASVALGIRRSISETMEESGPKTLYVQSQRPDFSFNFNVVVKQVPPVTMGDAEQIRRLPIVHDVTITSESRVAASFGRTLKEGVDVLGASVNWPSVTGNKLASGRNFTRVEYESAARVVVLNEVAAKLLLASPLDQRVKIKGEPFTVIGQFAGTSLFGIDEPRIVIPYPAYRALIGDEMVAGLQLAVAPVASASVDEASAAVTAALRVHRRLRPAQADNFAVTTQSQSLEQFQKVTRTLFLVMMLLSSLGLIVGGVGVVAVMTIAVTERTREIGVRKALGATRAEILFQFLVEAAALTLAGCIAGLAFGGLLAWGVRRATQIPTAIPLTAVLASMGMAVVTGMLFGLYPASRAAALDPVAALRHE